MAGHGENAADNIVADAINEVDYHADGNEYIDSDDNGFDEFEGDRPDVNDEEEIEPRIPRQNVKEALNEADDDDDGFDIGKDDKDRVTAKYKERCGWRIHAAKFGRRHSRARRVALEELLEITRNYVKNEAIPPAPGLNPVFESVLQLCRTNARLSCL
ncbi:hypothetical protein NC652_030722 [Populus alba x Populus x berolinensis]|nr:hypothetical protein NC652_030722 [Populus alba x Populus x berolinensis]